MENSVGSTIEKIKLQEQDKEIKLKEKRELETNISLLQRNIRDTRSQIEKLQEDEKIILQRIKKLAPHLEIEKIKNKALSSEVEVLKIELEELNAKVDQNISKVWVLRSTFCEEIQKSSDEYDVWALLMKPFHTDVIATNIKTSENEIFTNEGRLQTAIEKRVIAIAERNRLLAEPDNGEEFVRIKNALRYSLEKVASLKNSK